MEVIDVDAPPPVIDLTIPNVPIDLTVVDDDDDDVQFIAPLPRAYPRTKVSTYPKPFHIITPSGSSSSIHIKKRKAQSATYASSSRITLSLPPSKKPKVEEFIVVDDMKPPKPQVHPTQAQSKMRVEAPKRVFFELDSDGEDVEKKHKKQKRQDDESSDDEDVYARCHAGFDINDEDRWKPSKFNASKMTFDVAQRFEHLTVTEPTPTSILKRHRRPPDFSYPYKYAYKRVAEWTPAKRYLAPPEPRPIQSFLPTQLHRGIRQNIIQPMRQLTSFKSAPGSINHIEQFGDWIAVACAATGGHADESSFIEIDPYNKDGSIMVGKDQDHWALPGHFRQKNDSRLDAPQSCKYYTVNDVKFDPCSSSFVSAGNDKSVHIWTLNDEKNNYMKNDALIWRFPHPPTGLMFKPETSVIVVAERSLHLFSDISNSPIAMPPIILSGQKKKDHCVGAMAWGYGPTSNHLFASSEPLDATKFIGHHKAIDACEYKVTYTFNENGAGDEIAVTKDGARLALFTRKEERIHTLCIYDISRSEPNAQLSIVLPSFPSNIEGEVSNAAFSSDGIYLAVGRNDNHTHVYDSRYLDRLLFDYEHHGPSRINPGDESYGVVKVQWVDEDSTLPFGLVTGGNDGCVRFWSPRQADSNSLNGTILAETNSDIATFSIGDRYQREHPLVVGDSSGEIGIFRYQPQGFHSMFR